MSSLRHAAERVRSRTGTLRRTGPLEVSVDWLSGPPLPG